MDIDERMSGVDSAYEEYSRSGYYHQLACSRLCVDW